MTTKIELESTKRETKKANDAEYLFVVESARGANIRNVDNDTIAIDGDLSNYVIKATSSGVLITSKTDKQFKVSVTLQKANEKKGIDAGQLKLVFANGSLDLVRDGKTIKLEDGTVVSRKAKDAAAADLSSKLDASENFDGVTAEAPVDPQPQPGQTFVLTADKTSYTGTAGNDTFNSDVLTLTNDTVINGGNGVDTLNATLLAGTVAPTLNSVEKVFVEALGAVSVDASAFTGVQELWTRDSVGKLTVNGLTSAATVIGIKNTEQDVEVNYATSAIQGNTTVTVALDGAAGNTVTLKPDSGSTTNVVNNVVLNSIGGVANELKAISLQGNGAANDAARTLTVTGTQDLTIENALQAEINVINAGNMKGDLTLTAVGNADGLLFNGATMTGAANITVDNGVDNGAVIRTGSGDDTIKFDDLADAKLVNGGAGNDTLIATVNAADQAPVIQNVETLNLTFDGAGSLDAAAISGANKINVVNVENVGSLVINNMNTSIANIDVLDTDVTAAATLGFRSTVTGNLTVTTGADDDVTFSGVTVANVGSLSIVNADNVLGTGNLTLDNAKTTSLSVANSSAGNGAVTVGAVGGNKLASLAVDALSGNVTVSNVTTQSNLSVNVKAEDGRTVDTGNFNLVSFTADRALALTAAAAGTGVLKLDGAITAFGATLNVTSATGDVTVGTIDTANDADTASAAAVVNLTSTGGDVNIGDITADRTGGSIALDLSVLGAGVFGGTPTALDAFGDVSATLVSGTGNASFGKIDSAEGNIALNITSADGNVVVGAVEAKAGDVSVTINASDANSSNDNTVTLASLTGEKVTLNLVSDAGATVTNGIEATAAANTGRVIDVTLSGKGDVDLNTLTVSTATGNTTSVDASALEGVLTVTLSDAQDTVKLGAGADVITTSVTGSVFGAADWISGFSVAADTLVVKGVSDTYTIDKTSSGSTTKVVNLGNMTTEFTEANLAAFIGTALDSDKVGFFTVGGKSFLVVNDANNGFAAADDAIIEVTGIVLSMSDSLYYAV